MENNIKNESVWSNTYKENHFPSLDKDISVDVLVIGGGIAGILCAYYLNKLNYNVCVCEKNRIGQGITMNTTAVITAQHDTLYCELKEKVGYKKTKAFLDCNLFAVDEYKRLSEQYDFDFELKDSCNYSINNYSIIEKEKNVLKDLGYEAKIVKEIPLPITIEGGISFTNQAQMNPLKLITELASKLKVYENTNIIDIKDKTAFTKENKIRANKIIIATHFPIVNNLGFSMRMYQERSYVMSIRNDTAINGTYNDIEKSGLYFREYKDLLLIGGSDKRTGYRGEYYSKIKKFIKQNYPFLKITNYWANQDCITLDGLPYIGTVKDDIFVITGFNEWGMTQAMFGSHILCNLISNKEDKYAWAFNPKRCFVNRKFLKNSIVTITNLVNFKEKRCSHLGCALNFNYKEKSWDCPCHGSRFNKNGKVLNGPAKKDIKI